MVTGQHKNKTTLYILEPIASVLNRPGCIRDGCHGFDEDIVICYSNKVGVDSDRLAGRLRISAASFFFFFPWLLIIVGDPQHYT